MNETSILSPEQKLEAFAGKCLDAIKTREAEFEKTWWKTADEVQEIYDMDAQRQWESEVPYNILYSNTEVLLPSLYSATPKPDVRPRFRENPLKPIPDMLDRFLTVAADPAAPGDDCLDIAMSDAVLSALVPGMGYIRIRHIAERNFPITYESGHFKTLLWGKAPRWSKVPWIAFKHPMKRDAMLEKFGKSPEEAALEYVPSSESEDEKNDCCVYEFWDKATRKVYFLCEEWKSKCLSDADDPLKLANFFPTPGPMLLTAKPGKFSPIPLYRYYKNQAEELNRVTVRLNKVLSAIKVRGLYNGMLGDDLKALLSADDTENALIAAGEAAMLAQSGGLDKHIWFLPLKDLIEVAQQLYQARESIKQVIYEITGISDIIRGASVASETATAQDLKNKWGTVRLRRMQTIVGNYARDLFRITVDAASRVVPAKKWQEITQLPIPTAEEKQLAQTQLAYTQSQPQMPGQPPAQPDPKLVAQAQSPSMEELLLKIASDANRTYSVNIQTSSTIDLDTAQDKTQVKEFMDSMGQLMAGLAPLTELGPEGVEAAKAILIAVCQRFKFGLEIVPALMALKAPPPVPEAGPSPEEQKVIQAESELKLIEIAAKKQKTQGEMELQQAQLALEHEKLRTERVKLGIEIEKAQLSVTTARTKAAAAVSMPKKEPANAAVSA